MRILLAYDAQPASAGAVRTALSLAQETGAIVEVIRILEPAPFFGEEGSHALWAPEHEVSRERFARSLAGARAALAEFGETAGAWPVEIHAGPAAPAIAGAAMDGGADLIVLGLGRHEIRDRWFGTETALRVMQLSHVPVLALPADAGPLPKRILVAVDFSGFSRDAVRFALAISPDVRELHLAHVMPHPPSDPEGFFDPAAMEEVRSQIRDRLDEWAGELVKKEGVAMEAHVLVGEAAEELGSLGERIEPDLLAVGSHGLGFLGRLVIGSVSSRLVRSASCAVLVAPPAEPATGIRMKTSDAPNRLGAEASD